MYMALFVRVSLSSVVFFTDTHWWVISGLKLHYISNILIRNGQHVFFFNIDSFGSTFFNMRQCIILKEKKRFIFAFYADMPEMYWYVQGFYVQGLSQGGNGCPRTPPSG